MAGGACRHLPRCITAQRELLATLQHGGGRAGGEGGRVGQVQRCEVVRDLPQVGVAQRIDHARHQRVLALAGLEMLELVVQVARRFAGDAGVVAVGARAALLAVATGAGLHPLGQGVFKTGGGLCGGAPRDACGEQQGDQGWNGEHVGILTQFI
ncbi:hypothetical protein FQZ97_831460 [compost metagenome]